MRDTGAMMRGTFYGGPADGGEVILAEPIRTWLRFPMPPPVAAALLEPRPSGLPLIPNHIEAAYRLLLTTPDTPWRDLYGRVRYVYVPAHQHQPQPKETPHE